MVGGRRYTHRWPPATKPEVYEAWEFQTRAKAQLGLLPQHPPGSFAADAALYLKAVAALITFKERERDIGLWVAEFGTKRREDIRPVDIRIVRDRWLTEGPKLVQRWKPNLVTGKKDRVWEPVKGPLSASTVNHRLRALENLWTVLDGRHAYNPVRQVPEAEEPDAPPRALPVAIVRAILEAMPVSKAAARHHALGWIGIPPATLARMDASMVDWEHKTVWVPGRKKGKGTTGRTIPVSEDGLAALRYVQREDAWKGGERGHGNGLRTFRAACRTVEKQLTAAGTKIDLSKTRPYDLRHSIATLAALSGDFRVTELLIGVTSKTAQRYAKGAVDARLLAAVEALARAQRGESGPPAGPPTPEPHANR